MTPTAKLYSTTGAIRWVQMPTARARDNRSDRETVRAAAASSATAGASTGSSDHALLHYQSVTKADLPVPSRRAEPALTWVNSRRSAIRLSFTLGHFAAYGIMSAADRPSVNVFSGIENIVRALFCPCRSISTAGLVDRVFVDHDRMPQRSTKPGSFSVRAPPHRRAFSRLWRKWLRSPHPHGCISLSQTADGAGSVFVSMQARSQRGNSGNSARYSLVSSRDLRIPPLYISRGTRIANASLPPSATVVLLRPLNANAAANDAVTNRVRLVTCISKMNRRVCAARRQFGFRALLRVWNIQPRRGKIPS